MIIEGYDYLPICFEWLKTYPPFFLEILGREDQTVEEFCHELKGDLILNYFDGGLKAVCVAEDKGNLFYDVHIYTPRKFDQTKEAIFAFRDRLREIDYVGRCSFRFPAREKKIFEGLRAAGAVRTGWQYYKDNGVLYELMVWDSKSLQFL